MTQSNQGALLLIVKAFVFAICTHFIFFPQLVQAQLIKACPIKNGHLDRVGSIVLSPSLTAMNDCNTLRGVSWTSVTHTLYSDNNYATVALQPGESSKCLWVGGFNVNIPKGSKISGIGFLIEGHTEGGSVEANLIQLTNAQGSPLGSNKNYVKPPSAWASGTIGTDNKWQYGSNVDTWSTSLTTDLLSAAQFGLNVRLRNNSTLNTIIRIDRIQLQVYYEEISRMCMKNCAIFYVTPKPGALDYRWTFPSGSVVISPTSTAAEIALNVEGLSDGVHQLCVETRSAFGYSDQCCKLFLIDDCRPSKVGNRVWRDDNANGLQDPQEPGLKGIIVHLIDALTRQVIQTKHTDDQGRYLFEEVISGNYFLQYGFSTDLFISPAHQGNNKSLDSDLDHTNGNYTTETFYVATNTIKDDIDIGLYQYSSIGDFVWEDKNLNGVQDLSELGVEQIQLQLFDFQDRLIQTTQTDSKGKYKFSNLLPGKYYIQAQANTYLITSENKGRDTNKDSDFYADGKTDLFDLPFFTTLEDVDLGLIKSAAACGQVWFDANQNGKQDLNEKFVPSKKMLLFNSIGQIIDSIITNNNGEFNFSRLRPNESYRIGIQLMNDEIITSKDAHADDVDNDFNLNGLSDFFTADQDLKKDIDLGFYINCSISTNTLWLSQLSDDCYKNREINVTFSSTRTSAVPVDYTEYYFLINPSNGLIIDFGTSKRFDQLTAGSYRIISMVLNSNPNGYYYYNVNSIIKNSTLFEAIENELRIQNYCFKKSDNFINLNIENCSSISGTLWYDYGQDGIWDTSDRSIPSAKVCLLDQGGTILSEKNVDQNGTYSFNELKPSVTYKVKFKYEDQHTFTLKDASGFDHNDSDVNSSGESDPFVLAAATPSVIDAGLFYNCPINVGQISAMPIQDCFYGQSFQLVAKLAGGQLIPSHYKMTFILVNLRNQIIVATSDTPEFPIQAKGTYAIYAMVHAASSQDLNFIDLSAIQNGSTNFIQYTSSLVQSKRCFSISNRPATFIVNECIAIEGVAWKDENKNGTQDANESRYPLIKVDLLDENKTILESKLTNDQGEYKFEHYVSQRNYYIQFAQVPMYSFTIKGSVSNPLDSDVDRDGLSDLISISSGTTSRIDGGYYLNCVIQAADMVEQVIPVNCFKNTPVRLEAVSNGSHTVTSGFAVKYLLINDQISSVVQFSDNPSFDINEAGRYSIFALVYYNVQNSFDFFDINNLGLPMLFSNFKFFLKDKCHSLSSTPAIFELFQCKGIEGYVWEDYNKDGIQSQDERDLKDITVYLIDEQGNYLDTTLTNSQGIYAFSDLPVGSYRVRSILNSTFSYSPMDRGNDDLLDSDADQNGEIAVTIFTNSTVENADFGGIRDYMKIGNRVWHDINGDGIQDSNEPGWGEIILNLVDATNSEVIYTALSSNNSLDLGAYEIPYIPEGNHYIQFILPDSLCLTKFHTGSDNTLDNDFKLINFSWRSEEFTSVLNTTNSDLDAGIFFKSTIGDYVWLDENQNGIQDPTENGINGVTVQVFNRQGRQTGEILTRYNPDNNKDGFYEFNDFVPGDYYLRFISADYNAFTTANLGIESEDSDVTNSNGNGTTDFFTIISHSYDVHFDAGYIPNGVVGSFIWLDQNADGIQSELEYGLANTKVYLYGDDMNVKDSIFSNDEGQYQFNAAPGHYFLMFEAPEGYNFTKHIDSNQEINSDITGFYGEGSTNMLELRSGISTLNIDAGFIANSVLASEQISCKGRQVGENIILDIYTVGLTGELQIEKMLNGVWQRMNNELVQVSLGKNNIEFIDDKLGKQTDHYYRVKVITEGGEVIVSDVTHVEIQRNSVLHLSPMPFHEYLMLKSSDEDAIWVIENSLGQLVQKILTQRGEARIDTKEWPEGIYNIYSLTSKNERRILIKQ